MLYQALAVDFKGAGLENTLIEQIVRGAVRRRGLA
jgi:hypothetical protein